MTGERLPDQLFLTVPEVAGILRTDPRTVRRAIEAGDITAVRVSGVVRVPTQTFLAECGLAAATVEPANGEGDDEDDDEPVRPSADGEERRPAALRVVPADGPMRGPPRGTTPAA